MPRSDLELPLSPEALKELVAFCDLSSNRFDVLKSSLNRRDLPYEVLPFEGAKHVVIPVRNALGMDREYYRVTLVAHYDRYPGTPGANDNAAAVFQLLDHLEQIRSLNWKHRTQVIFTDKEELLDDQAGTDQGAWALAKELKRKGADNLLFFVLDMCGIGDVPVWGRSLRKAGLEPGEDSVGHAYSVMESFLLKFTRGRSYGANPLFSDDLGLLLGGYPALQLSLLPRREAENLLIRANSEPSHQDSGFPARFRDQLRADLPASWRVNHSPEDTVSTLTSESFHLMARLLRDLARYRFPLPS